METVYVDITDERQMWDAIRRLVVRGAPAIGVAAAFGVYLGVRGYEGDRDAVLWHVREVCNHLATSRPTAVNLFWALDRMKRVAAEEQDPQRIKGRLLDEAIAMVEEDTRVVRAIGEHGLKLLEELVPRGRQIDLLTHCNAGGLATVQYGTALAPIYLGAEQGLKFHVYADETRPLLQGSRITAYELKQNGIPVTVICDGMAATVLAQKKVNAVIVGATGRQDEVAWYSSSLAGAKWALVAPGGNARGPDGRASCADQRYGRFPPASLTARPKTRCPIPASHLGKKPESAVAVKRRQE